MEQNEEIQGSLAFGAYLRRVREGRRLSLDAVEELSVGFPEKVTKSHLSRIENGLALPTFPRLMAMSQIYGVPIASLAERYEIDLRRQLKPTNLDGMTEEDALRKAESLVYAGEFNEALLLIWALLDATHLRPSSDKSPVDIEREVDLRLKIAVCLIKLGRCEYAKSICEDVLGRTGFGEALRAKALFLFAHCCHLLRRHTFALMALEECDRATSKGGVPARLQADILALRGIILKTTGDATAALETYERAAAAYRALGNNHEEINTRISQAAALMAAGQVAEARAVLTSVLAALESKEHHRLRALALTNLAQVAFSEGNSEEAERLAIQANLIARPREYTAITFLNTYCLWKISIARGDASSERMNFKTLRSLAGRIEEQLPELDEFQSMAARGES